MQKHILFPTDFSETSHNAFSYALEIAAQFNGKITLLHVQYESPIATQFIPTEFIKGLKEKRVESAKRVLDQYKQEARKYVGEGALTLESQISEGKVLQKIKEFCQTQKPDLIIMGTDGYKSVNESIRGSITTNLIAQTEIPVMAIPHARTFAPLKNLVYALDPVHIDYVLIDRLLEYCDVLNAKLTCLYVVRSEDDESSKRMVINERLFLMEQQGKLSVAMLQQQEVIEGINAYMCDHRTDLLVMSTHNKDVGTPFSKSITNEMVLYTEVPVMVFHTRVQPIEAQSVQ
ncbi:MAG: universal stress protein [Bacteroidota bacterium]